MAVDPDLQRVAEDGIVRPTITVVTNARLDHTDVQGTDAREIAAGFPVRWGGTLVTADPVVASVLGPRVRATGGSVHLVDPASVGRDVLRRMAYLEHPANIAIALGVSGLLGIDRDTALRGLASAEPDPGVASVLDLPDARGDWTLVNLFAANDSESTLLALETTRDLFGIAEQPVALFTSRGDRAARSAEFAAALAANKERFSRLVVWGHRTGAMCRKTRARGFPPDRIVDAGSRPPEALTELLLDEMEGRSRVVVGMGNIVGLGQRWLTHLAGILEREGAAA
jgi:poly-gamma-glutamate synthase PgsB/CapB